MAESIKDNIVPKPKPSTVVDIYTDIFTFRKHPISEAFVERLACDVVKWAVEDDEAFKMTQFFRKMKISSQTYYRWVKTFRVLKVANSVALEAIGDRREIGAIKRKYDAGFIASQMAKYDKSWWNLEKQRAELKASTQQKGDSDITYKIIVDSYKEEDKKKTDNMPEE